MAHESIRGPVPTPPMERIGPRSVRADRGYITPCRVFTGALDDRGYGVIGVGVRATNRVHVLVYEHVYGPVIHQLHHRCKQKDCHEPLHLVDLTHREHAQEHLKTHCAHGHEYTPDNTYVVPKTGARHCRTCGRRRDAVQKARRRLTSQT